MYQRFLWTLLSLAVGCSAGFADTFSVTLKAVDADQKPVAKADVALFWTAKDGVMTAAGGKPTVTDAAGKALLQVDNWNEKRPVMVLSADRKLGGIVGVSKDDEGKEVTATLGPTVRVKGQLECRELNAKPRWANTLVTPDGFRGYFTQDMTTAATFAFVLPAGKYQLRSYGTDVEDFKQTVTLAADRPEHDFGTIDLKASAVAKLKGKTPPGWVIADARGVKPDVPLADYKGKWVYLEFWGYW
jgi:hypothetical protein